MDTEQLQAQRRQAEAQLQRAMINVETAKSLVNQREAERKAAEAVVDQRIAQLDTTSRKLERSEQLIKTSAVSQQVLDDDRSANATANAALAASPGARSPHRKPRSAPRGALVIDAGAAVDAAKAAIESINADLNDSVLKAPRDGRVQYRVSQPGEVLAGGGRVLNMVDLGDVYMTFFLPTVACRPRRDRCRGPPRAGRHPAICDPRQSQLRRRRRAVHARRRSRPRRNARS